MEVDVIEYVSLETILAQIVVDAEVSPSGILVFTRRNGETFSGGSITGVWEDFDDSLMNPGAALVVGDGTLKLKYMKVGETVDLDFRFFGGSTTSGNGTPISINVPHEPFFEFGVPGGIILPGWFSDPGGSLPAFMRVESSGAPGGTGLASFYRFNPASTGMQAVTSVHLVENSELKFTGRYHIQS